MVHIVVECPLMYIFPMRLHWQVIKYMPYMEYIERRHCGQPGQYVKKVQFWIMNNFLARFFSTFYIDNGNRRKSRFCFRIFVKKTSLTKKIVSVSWIFQPSGKNDSDGSDFDGSATFKDTFKVYFAFKCHIWICVNFCRHFFYSFLVGWLDRLA